MNANLCETCSVIQFDDDDIAEFYEAEQGNLPPSLSIDGCGRGHKIPLDYEVVDFLPTLPLLEQSAGRGCEFCSILRHEIIRVGFNYRGYVQINLEYHWGNYFFEELGLSALVAELTWRSDIPSLPPSTTPPDNPRHCVIFTLESDDSRVASWLRIPGLRKDNVLCEENLRFITQAIDRCESECGHSCSTGHLPTRLLDLGPDPGSDSVRLIITSESLVPSGTETKPPRYAALSYCWGSKDDAKSQLCTNLDSIEARKTSIPKDAMSAVMWDAVTVCRSLGIRYLWIDALCILQDNKADWESESSNMSLIYSEAFVTICAVSSTSCRESFLMRDRHHVVINFQSSLWSQISGSYSLVASGTCKDNALFGWPDLDVYETTWSSRGWTLQEEVLSRRRLFFGESMIHLECSKFLVSENGYRFQRDNEGLTSLRLEENGIIRNILNPPYKGQYTNESDRLPGISGLARYFSEMYKDTYLAGLWKNDLPYAFLWHFYTHLNPKFAIDIPGLIKRLRDPDPYIAPSWSPVRRDGAIIENGIRAWKQELLRDAVTNQCEILEVETKPIGENRWGAIRAGFIRIRGRLKRVPSDLHLSPWDRNLPRGFFIGCQKKVVAFGNLDCKSSFPQLADDLWMLRVASTQGGVSLRHGAYEDGDSADEDEYSTDEDGDSADEDGDSASNEGNYTSMFLKRTTQE
ncbi:hypothetical protein LCI18_004066 [Fusarium solani-melongenae]|uniref:Uncharacterized protein n=1 Tax=Fusarium solani subsp. cucurbitae TaxID=2747967 RepID=A0ACD3YW30_FUSSC|nr:hypothetical protein LCI18_004066 [Fusarium solani-melongenae]